MTSLLKTLAHPTPPSWPYNLRNCSMSWWPRLGLHHLTLWFRLLLDSVRSIKFSLSTQFITIRHFALLFSPAGLTLWWSSSTASGSCCQPSWSWGSACVAGFASQSSSSCRSRGSSWRSCCPRTSRALTSALSCCGRSWESFLSFSASHLEYLQQQSNPPPPGPLEPPGHQETRSPPHGSRPRWSLWMLRTLLLLL